MFSSSLESCAWKILDYFMQMYHLRARGSSDGKVKKNIFFKLLTSLVKFARAPEEL